MVTDSKKISLFVQVAIAAVLSGFVATGTSAQDTGKPSQEASVQSRATDDTSTAIKTGTSPAIEDVNKENETAKDEKKGNKTANADPVTGSDKQEKNDKANETEPAPPATFEGRITAHILKELGDKPGGRSGRELQKWNALTKFYQTEGRVPLWINVQGMSEKSRIFFAEIKRADDYGLVPSEFDLPAVKSTDLQNESALAEAELKISRQYLKYADQAKDGRADPEKAGRQMQDRPEPADPVTFLEAASSSSDLAAYLQSLHPQHPQFLALREQLKKLRNADGKKSEFKIPAGPVLKLGVKHAQVALLRKRLTVSPFVENLNLFDETLEDAVRKFQKKNGLAPDGVVGAGTRKILNGNTDEKLISKILINMERWRWLPDDLGGDANIYVWANIPEFRVRVVKNDKIVFSEKAIVGEIKNKTPVFSESMEWIEIHPTWYVPNSIKVADILPSLKRSTSRVMERYHLKMNCGRLGSNPKTIDWTKVDITRCSFTQPPGQKSVLGDFKFKFPNKHSVYMHDTHKPQLFNSATRAYSHGCVRVKNPRRMAEILLEHDGGLSSEELGRILAGPRTLHKAEFKTAVPVHMTYFTIFFEKDGSMISRPDYYGHDRRLANAMTGNGHLFYAPQSVARKPKKKKKSTQKEVQNFWNNFIQN